MSIVPAPSPIFFSSPSDFRSWLSEHHASERELWVGFHKKATGRPSLTWPESVDEALCFGWIDGIRKSVGSEGYMIRFTPRKPASNWSRVNLARAKALIDGGRMTPAGLRAFEARQEESAYSFEQRTAPRLAAGDEARFRADPAAWDFFQAQPPGYRRLALWWVVSAKREETRARRLDTLIADSAAGQRIGGLRRPDEP